MSGSVPPWGPCPSAHSVLFSSIQALSLAGSPTSVLPPQFPEYDDLYCKYCFVYGQDWAPTAVSRALGSAGVSQGTPHTLLPSPPRGPKQVGAEVTHRLSLAPWHLPPTPRVPEVGGRKLHEVAREGAVSEGLQEVWEPVVGERAPSAGGCKDLRPRRCPARLWGCEGPGVAAHKARRHGRQVLEGPAGQGKDQAFIQRLVS